MTAESAHIEDFRNGGWIDLICTTCGQRQAYPNKGLGRAFAATWKTQHQHIAPPGVAHPSPGDC